MLLRLHTFLLTFGMTLLVEGLIAGVFRPAWLLRGEALAYRAFLLAGAIALLVTGIELAVTLLHTGRSGRAVASINEMASAHVSPRSNAAAGTHRKCEAPLAGVAAN